MKSAREVLFPATRHAYGMFDSVEIVRFEPKPDQHQGRTVHDLVSTVERVNKNGCQVPALTHGQEEFCCGQPVLTFCGDCGTNICMFHAVKCCMETYCDSCVAIHRQRRHQ